MPVEQNYRDTVNRVAFAMLVFEGLFFVAGFAFALLQILTDLIPNTVTATVVYELCYAAIYAAIFVLPVLFFKLFSLNKRTERMYLEYKLPRETVLYVFAAVALVSAAAAVNSFMVNIFNYGTFSDEVLWGQTPTTNYELVLMVITTAVVPAFVEEFLFRGLVLTNLLPYGRTTAVLASALLFGLMHQNAGQLFYATAAGLVLGFIYVKTRSVWVCVLIHFVNNFTSVIQSVLAERLSYMNANLVLGLVQGAIYTLGIISAVILMLRVKDRRGEVLRLGCFERELEADPDYAGEVIPFARRVRLFFTAPMIVFFVLSVMQMFSLVALAALLY